MVKTAGQDDKLAFLSTPLYDTTMKRRDLVLEQNQSKTTIEVFMALCLVHRTPPQESDGLALFVATGFDIELMTC